MATPPTRRQIDLNLYLCEQTLMWSKFIGGLATLQEAIQSVSSAYIKHTNAVLGEHGAGYDIDTALSKLGENPFLGNLGALQRAASPVVAKATSEQAPEKKERKKRQHDPNAPKRPLTPFFLYMQTARPIIAKDLGDVPKGEVSSEGTKRWTDMAAKDKAVSFSSQYVISSYTNTHQSFGKTHTKTTSVSTMPACTPTAKETLRPKK